MANMSSFIHPKLSFLVYDILEVFRKKQTLTAINGSLVVLKMQPVYNHSLRNTAVPALSTTKTWWHNWPFLGPRRVTGHTRWALRWRWLRWRPRSSESISCALTAGRPRQTSYKRAERTLNKPQAAKFSRW